MSAIKSKNKRKKVCVKCGRTNKYNNLSRHHIKFKMDGGTDKPKNLILLCKPCHGEWHALEISTNLKFKKWLEYPPAIRLIAIYDSILKTDEDTLEKISMLSYKKIIIQQLDSLKENWESYY